MIWWINESTSIHTGPGHRLFLCLMTEEKYGGQEKRSKELCILARNLTNGINSFERLKPTGTGIHFQQILVLKLFWTCWEVSNVDRTSPFMDFGKLSISFFAFKVPTWQKEITIVAVYFPTAQTHRVWIKTKLCSSKAKYCLNGIFLYVWTMNINHVFIHQCYLLEARPLKRLMLESSMMISLFFVCFLYVCLCASQWCWVKSCWSLGKKRLSVFLDCCWPITSFLYLPPCINISFLISFSLLISSFLCFYISWLFHCYISLILIFLIASFFLNLLLYLPRCINISFLISLSL